MSLPKYYREKKIIIRKRKFWDNIKLLDNALFVIGVFLGALITLIIKVKKIWLDYLSDKSTLFVIIITYYYYYYVIIINIHTYLLF